MSSTGASATAHPIVLDDTDPSIRYTANQWFSHDVNQLNVLGNTGPIWNGTTTSTSVDGATLSFSFSGTSISVTGTLQITQLANGGGVDPTWACTIDDIPIPTGGDPNFQFPENNWSLCDEPTLLPGNHTLHSDPPVGTDVPTFANLRLGVPTRAHVGLSWSIIPAEASDTLKIRVTTKGQPFYVDSIQYTPTPDVSIDGSVLQYEMGDPAQAMFSLHGTSLLVTGFVPQQLPHNATTGKYTVDDGAATTFKIPGLPPDPGTSTLFHMPMFSVDGLSPATHKVVVTYLGDSNHTPLTIKDWFVTSSNTSGVSSAPGSSGPPTTSVLGSSSSGAPGSSGSGSGSGGTKVADAKSLNTSAIAGIVVGGLVILAVLGALFFLRLRRQRGDMSTTRAVDSFMLDTAEVPYTVRAGARAAASLPAQTRPCYSYAQPEYKGQHTRAPTDRTPSASGTGAGAQIYSPVPPQDFVFPLGTGSAAGSGGGALGAVGVLTPLQTTEANEAAPQGVVVQLHQDSGVRLGDAAQLIPSLLLLDGTAVVDLPPNYSRD
ncbi:hypothetical protein B0H19DRAFT_1269030 [Mycena capillaripes]|nr:hypothetical protein B0H19DRAFT_1269030 [Mycena capillaripes]